MKKVRVLILGNSLLTRESLAQELERDVNIEVVAKAVSAVDARDKIVEYLPDILIADANLGDMSGIEFIRKLLPQYYLPVIMMSADPALERPAMDAKAAAFIKRPIQSLAGANDLFFKNILARVKAIVAGDAAKFDIAHYASMIVAIGASTGGAEAIEKVLTGLPAVLPPLVIAQHMPPRFTHAFALRMNSSCLLSVKEAEEGEALLPGVAYIAPGGLNTTVKRAGERFYIALVENDHKSYACPSIDMLFHSVADVTHGRSIGVLLTGMGKDGAAGLKRMHDAGAKTIGQDEATSVVYGMPKVAFDNGSVDYQLPLSKIPLKIQSLLGR